MAMPEILTVKEVSDYLRVSERTVLEWAQKGEVPCGKLGNSWRFRREEIDRWVDSKLSKNRTASPPPVSIREVLRPERVLLLDVERKQEAFDALIDCFAASKAAPDRAELAQALARREELMSTGIGLGVGVPHVRMPSVSKMVMAAATSRSFITDYASLDGMPVRLIFMIVAGQGQHAEYLRLLASIGRRIKVGLLRDQLLDARDPRAFYDLLVEEG
jgi:nitrogen PTS system EIIA component